MSDMECVLKNGDIYIQRGLRKIYHSKDKNIEYVTEFSMNLDDRNNYYIDNRGVNSFFSVISDSVDKYRLVELDNNKDLNRCILLDDISIEELNRGYIKLSDFIKESTFIGREFKRISPVITYYGNSENRCEIRDSSYVDKYGYDNNKYIVLYMKDNTCLVKYICTYGEGYCIIDCRYIKDGKYKFVGDVYDQYKDRLGVYFDILKYLNMLRDINVKKRVR